MKSDRPWRHFLLAFVIAVVLYAVAYSAIEHRRTRKGPWQIAFTTGPRGPLVTVNQPGLGITNVQISFPGQRATNSVSPPAGFATPQPVPYDVPFGKCLFMDTTFLPGTLTFNWFGHEIEFLPRVMVIDHEEHAWRSGEVIELGASIRPAAASSASQH
jgi:hypothetical protein